jgi:hypothetical protein
MSRVTPETRGMGRWLFQECPTSKALPSEKLCIFVFSCMTSRGHHITGKEKKEKEGISRAKNGIMDFTFKSVWSRHFTNQNGLMDFTFKSVEWAFPLLKVCEVGISTFKSVWSGHFTFGNACILPMKNLTLQKMLPTSK